MTTARTASTAALLWLPTPRAAPTPAVRVCVWRVCGVCVACVACGCARQRWQQHCQLPVV
jgi:hypothetical protein